MPKVKRAAAVALTAAKTTHNSNGFTITEGNLWLASHGRLSSSCRMAFIRKSTSRRIAKAMPKPFWKRSSGKAASYPARGVSTRDDLGRSDFWPAANRGLHDAFAPGVRIYDKCGCGLRRHYAPAPAICSLASFLDPRSFAAILPESPPGDHQHVVGRSGIGEPGHV